MGVGMHEFQGESGRNAEERRLKRKEAMAGVMIRRDRGKWKREREREREREKERKGEPKRKQERKVDGTTSLALMRAIQLPQCSSNTIPTSSTSNESSSTGADVVVFEPVRIFKRKLLMYVCVYAYGEEWDKGRKEWVV